MTHPMPLNTAGACVTRAVGLAKQRKQPSWVLQTKSVLVARTPQRELWLPLHLSVWSCTVLFYTGGPTRHVELYIPLGVRYVSSHTGSVSCASLSQTCHIWSLELPLVSVHLKSAVRNKSRIRGIVHLRLPLDFLLRITLQRMNSD